MRRFAEVLLLAACTFLPLSLANDLEVLHPAVRYNPQRKEAVIRGLLDRRQVYYTCYPEYQCEAHCCPGGWICCRTGICCSPGQHCYLGSNGVMGCCLNGELCSGPVGPPHTINAPSPKQTTYYDTSTITRDSTTASTSTTTSTSTSTTTFTTLVGAPTPSAGSQIIEVTVLDVNITWSQNWVQETSSCDRSITSKSTSTGNSSFTYLFHGPPSKSGYYNFYFNVVNYNTRWEVFVDGVSQEMYYPDSTSFTNCTFINTIGFFDSTWPSQNLTILVHGSDGLDSSTSGQWSLEFNKLLIKEPNPASSTSTAPFPGTTGLALSAAGGRAQPYRPLMVFGSILLAVVYCA